MNSIDTDTAIAYLLTVALGALIGCGIEFFRRRKERRAEGRYLKEKFPAFKIHAVK